MKDKIKDLLVSGKLAEAIEKLAPFNEEISIITGGDLRRLENEYLHGKLDRDTYKSDLNKITGRLLKALNATDFSEKAGGAQPGTTVQGTSPDQGASSVQNTPPVDGGSSKKSVFFSYAQEDKKLQKRLRKHLAVLRRSDKIDVWSDEEIKAGSELSAETIKLLHSADIILLLVSPDFVDSDDIWNNEIKIAMQRHERKEAVVVPIILRSVSDWHELPFGKLKALPNGGKPVTEWPNTDQALFNVAEGIKRLL
ncbi:MAG: TIR domain-containing protein [Bacteroidota bacterium]